MEVQLSPAPLELVREEFPTLDMSFTYRSKPGGRAHAGRDRGPQKGSNASCFGFLFEHERPRKNTQTNEQLAENTQTNKKLAAQIN